MPQEDMEDLTQMVKSENLPLKATSVRGMATMYGVGKTKIREAIKEGRLRAVRIGRRVVIRIADAEAFIAGCEEVKPKPASPRRSRNSGGNR